MAIGRCSHSQNKNMYDIIGDIHGRALELEALLTKLGYRLAGSSFRHENRRAVFLGDFVDRGPHQRRVLDIVRPMVSEGSALAVMGNHEFNAIAYHTPDGNGGYLRSRNAKNTHQHRAFLDELVNSKSIHVDITRENGETAVVFAFPCVATAHPSCSQI